jgi:site-specific DNA-adenine methylase
MPFGVIERAVINDDADQLLVLTKSVGLSWETTKAMLVTASRTKSRSKQDVDRFRETFTKLRLETAKKVVQFYRLRQKSASSQIC